MSKKRKNPFLSELSDEEKGDLESVKWMFDNYDSSVIVEELQSALERADIVTTLAAIETLISRGESERAVKAMNIEVDHNDNEFFAKLADFTMNTTDPVFIRAYSPFGVVSVEAIFQL